MPKYYTYIKMLYITFLSLDEVSILISAVVLVVSGLSCKTINGKVLL